MKRGSGLRDAFIAGFRRAPQDTVHVIPPRNAGLSHVQRVEDNTGDSAPGSSLRWRVEPDRDPSGQVQTLDARLVPVGDPAPTAATSRSRRRRALILLLPVLGIAAAGTVAATIARATQREEPMVVVAEPSESPNVLQPASEPPPAPVVDLAAVQGQLTDLRYYVGPIDGQQSPPLQSALVAFQKVHDLPASGVLGEETLAALSAPRQPDLTGGEQDRLEVDLTRQVLYLVQDGQLARIMPGSSGNGEIYETAEGTTARGLTPIGEYRVERRIAGERQVPLGTMYDPLYFYRGWAIHGSTWVPAEPASHGCVRITREDATWLYERAPIGLQVILYGGIHTFPAGSTAAGTNNPAGDTAEDTVPEPVPPIVRSESAAPPAAPAVPPPPPPPPTTAPPTPAPTTPVATPTPTLTATPLPSPTVR